MKQITIVLHYNDDEYAAKMRQYLKEVKEHGEDGSIALVYGRDIVHLEMKGPND